MRLSWEAFDVGSGIEVGRWNGGGSPVRDAVPPEGASLEHISMGIVQRGGLFKAREISSGHRPSREWSLWSFFLRDSV